MIPRCTQRLTLLALVLWSLLAAPPFVAAHPHSPSVRPSEVIVRLRPHTNLHAFAATNGLRPSPDAIDSLPDLAVYRFHIADGTPPVLKARELNVKQQVLSAEPNTIGAIPEAQQRSSWVVGGDANAYASQWGPEQIQLPSAHTISRGAGVTIAALDTGVDRTHPALAGRLELGYDFVNDDDDPSEQGTYGSDAAFGHGTHVAGLLALAAPEARILPLRTLRPDGSGDIWTQIRAIQYAVDHGARVINLSYSFDVPSAAFRDMLATITCAKTGSTVCQDATRPGVVVVAAAGNSGVNTREYPAADVAPGVVAVAASTESDTLASFSTYGSWVKVAAPGDRILSTIPGGGYAVWSGTSMATPLVAGEVALVRAVEPTLQPAETVTRIITTGTPMAAPVRRLANADAALRRRLAAP